jgi:hypothetical protein
MKWTSILFHKENMPTFMFNKIHQMHFIRSYRVWEFWKLHNSFEKIVKEKGFYFDNLVNCLYSLDFKFVPQLQITCARNNHARKYVKLFIGIMRKSKVLQLGLQLGFWVVAHTCNSRYLYELEFYPTSCNGREYNSTYNN